MDISCVCAICKSSLADGQSSVTLYDKGSKSINHASELRGDDIVTSPGQSVHFECRRDYCDKRLIKRHLQHKTESPSSDQKLRSRVPKFDFQNHCLFCSQPIAFSGKKRAYDEITVFPVRTDDFKKTVERVCIERGDEWSQQVRSRVEFAQDLHAKDAVYHQMCNINFRTGKQIPHMYQKTTMSEGKGRPVDSSREQAFLKVAAYLQDNDDEQVTVGDLVSKMQDYCDDPYSNRYMKAKLQQHFGDKILITNANGKSNVATFKTTASAILDEFYRTPKSTDTEEEKRRIIAAAARLIKNDVKAVSIDRDFYPDFDNISDLEQNLSFVPDSLQQFLRAVFTEKKPDLKIASIGQAIMQAARPRLLVSPLQIGLAVQMHHHFASKFLIDSLSTHGFCVSYSEVKRFEMCAAVSQGTDTPSISGGQFVQFVADNADHNVRTIDGLNTFHGMGIIAAHTPGSKQHKPVPRDTVTSQDLADIGKIKISFFKQDNKILTPLTLELQNQIEYVDQTTKLDLLWKIAWPLRSPKPGWSGMMQAVHQGTYPGQSSVTFLPMIDMSASDMSCIYSTLRFVCAEAKRLGVTPIITFDQPLWWKAQIIVASEPAQSDLHSVVLRLGAFHAEMSFLGCIGYLMSGSGIQELLEVVYASNTVVHMLSGKAVGRAIRGHMLVDSALNAIVIENAFNLPRAEDNCPPCLSQELTDETEPTLSSESSACVDMDIGATQQVPVLTESQLELDSALQLYDRLMAGDLSAQSLCASNVLDKIQETLENKKAELREGRTGKLWVQYMEMVDLLRQLIKAERTGDWTLHLQTLQGMLPYYAAAGHNLYAKSVYIYVQQMLHLPQTHPDVYTYFMSGYHVVRRSDRYWAGLSSDLVIEQTLMRTMKTSGGLTHGRGIDESQRTQWVLSMPACSRINGAMQQFTGIASGTSEQHKECTTARQMRDDKDIRTLHEYLTHRNPFQRDASLQNIATGVTADISVNADTAKEVGCKIIQSMVGKNAFDYSFKSKEKVISMDNKSCTKVDGEPINVDPQLLFQRLLTAARDTNSDLSSIFIYELCNKPPSLFDSAGLLREANKPALADAIWSAVKGDMMPAPPSLHGEMQYVLDGGSLLHRLQWPRGATFTSVCQMYVDYVCRKFHTPTIVFDGYEAGPSTKDVAHLRRSGGVVGTNVRFDGNMLIKSKKEHFLTNKGNKQRFVNMLSEHLQAAGCKTVHAEGDADVLIATTAVEQAKEGPTTVIGEDTDLLILLCYHADHVSPFPLYLQSDKQSNKKHKTWDIHWTQSALGPDICSSLLFVHAIAGCDTTSRLFGIGKGVPLRKLMHDQTFRDVAMLFTTVAPKEQIVQAGEQALVCLYGGQSHDSLDNLRYKKFTEKVMTSLSAVQVNTLPPTSDAARHHSARVYYQVHEWMGDHADLDPEEWGWILHGDTLEPRTTNLTAAPDALLRVVRCKCKTDCNSKRCTCRKLGLECSIACTECKGTSCTNAPKQLENTSEAGSDD